MNLIRRAACLVLALVAFATSAMATSYLPVADRDLADAASVIALVEVVAVEPGPAGQLPTTDYIVEVDELVQGELAGGTVVVRVPGGMGADGVGLKVDGAPELNVGEQTLLFLQAGADGTYTILHLMLGAFHARTGGGGLVAEQDLDGAVRIAAAGAAKEEGVERDLGRFVGWLADRAAGVQRSADYWVRMPNAGAGREAKAYTHFATSDQIPARWFGFESGARARWKVQSSGMPGLGLDATVASVQAAIDAWNSDSTSSITYAYDGLTDANGGLAGSDSVNGFLFGDPHGTIAGSFDCKKGGALAIGGAWFWSSTGDYRGRQYHEINEADVVVNDGAECFLANNPSGAAEVFAHELGHTLGFGHASDADALMAARAHNDGRGARLSDDDRTGASVVYGDGSYKPTPSGPGPGSSQPFTVAAGETTQTQVQLSWTHSFSEVGSFRVELAGKKGTYQVLTTVAGGETGATVAGLKKNQSLTLRITALRPDGAVAGTSNTLKVRTKK